MKKVLLLSFVASTMIMAGGDFAPVEEPVIVTPEVIDESAFYVGIAYGYMGDEYTRTPNTADPRNFDETQNTIMFQAGYKYNAYVAFEARYWAGVDDLAVFNGTVGYDLAGPDAWGIYVKPMYPVTEEFDIYALLGYASVDHSSVKLNTVDGFSWGLGASYAFTENVSMFVDYTSLYDDDRNLPASLVNKAYVIDTVNVGVTYSF